MLFQAEQKLVLIGDSIIESGRDGDQGQGPYGNGFVNLLHSLLTARYPELRLTIVNRGKGGDKVRELAARWQQDVIDERPDWLAIMIGINDAYHALPLSEYEMTLRRLLDWAGREIRANIILITPYLIEDDHTNWERIRMDRYSAILKQLAREYEGLLVDTQAAFDTVAAVTGAKAWSDDRVHPELPGHAVIALAFLRAVGFTL